MRPVAITAIALLYTNTTTTSANNGQKTTTKPRKKTAAKEERIQVTSNGWRWNGRSHWESCTLRRFDLLMQ
jgi:hypothetical protein